jgi:hypothetical protein
MPPGTRARQPSGSPRSNPDKTSSAAPAIARPATRRRRINASPRERQNHPQRASRSKGVRRPSGKQSVNPRRNHALAGFRPPHHPRQLPLSVSRENLRADKHPWTATIGADIGIPYGLVGVVAARTRRGTHIGRGRRRWYGRRGGGGSDDGPGHQATKHACSHGAPPASSIGSRGCERCHRNGNRCGTTGDKASLHR